MKVFEIMYDNAVTDEHNILAKVIRTLPYFVAHLTDTKILNIIKVYPDVLNYNFNKNPITFNILNGSNDVISVRLKNLCHDKNFKDFESTNKIIAIMLINRLVVPIDESHNKVFFNYFNKINMELNRSIIYSAETNYSKELLTLHLEIMGKPMVEF